MPRITFRVVSVNGRRVAERVALPERTPNKPKERRDFRTWLLEELRSRGHALAPDAPYREIARALRTELRPVE